MGELVKLRGLRGFVGCVGRLDAHSSDPRGMRILIASLGGRNLKNEKKSWKYGEGVGLLKRGRGV